MSVPYRPRPITDAERDPRFGTDPVYRALVMAGLPPRAPIELPRMTRRERMPTGLGMVIIGVYLAFCAAMIWAFV